jgi:S-formylglutathione hydrolase FrmB
LGSGAMAAQSTSSPSPPRLVTITIPSRGDISSQWLSYTGPPRANVLLPAGYDPTKHYPLLVLLNGFNTDYDWYAQWGFLPLFDKLDAIVVMPEGASGFYTDWWNGGKRGNPAWESYELDVVLPAILARYPILPQRRYHAIAGISMGGLGAAYLAARLPSFFGSIATLSGAVDTQYVAPVSNLAFGALAEAPIEGDDNPYPIYGLPYGFYAGGHNPTDLVMDLEQTRVFESTGNGVPSSADLGDPSVLLGDQSLADLALEGRYIYPMNQIYHRALVSAGVDVTYQVHQGGHLIPDFLNEVKAMLAWGLFKPVVTAPSSWINNTVATTGQLWDIDYRFAQPPDAVVQFRRSGSSLSVSAAGSQVTITTSTGCVITTSTPATIHIPNHRCS